MTAKEVSERLGVREFLALCETIDLDYGNGTKFEVIKVERLAKETAIKVTVLLDKFRAEDVGIDVSQMARKHSCRLWAAPPTFRQPDKNVR